MKRIIKIPNLNEVLRLKSPREFGETDSGVVELRPIRDDLESRIQQINRGWKKLTAAQQKRAFRTLPKFYLLSACLHEGYAWSEFEFIDNHFVTNGDPTPTWTGIKRLGNVRSIQLSYGVSFSFKT